MGQDGFGLGVYAIVFGTIALPIALTIALWALAVWLLHRRDKKRKK